ncbi:hypothetical protein MMC22_010060 [Lobaria immixta]|nr:hypothetical protein [Lobaria immixta]
MSKKYSVYTEAQQKPSSLAAQIRTERIGLADFLHRRRVSTVRTLHTGDLVEHLLGIIQILRDVVWASEKDKSTVYNSSDHVICISQNQLVTIEAGAEYEGASGSFSLDGNIHEGGICLFPRSAGLTLEQIRPLTDSMLQHGCTTCGSAPIYFIDQGSNDPGAGILIFNYVKNPCCDGNCISATGETPASPRVRRSKGSYTVRGQGDQRVNSCNSGDGTAGIPRKGK